MLCAEIANNCGIRSRTGQGFSIFIRPFNAILGFFRHRLSQGAHAGRALPWLVAGLALARIVVLLSAQSENVRSVTQFHDVNLSGSLRDRSLDLYVLTQRGTEGDWRTPLGEMQRIRTGLQARYPGAVAAGDPAWNAFRESLSRSGRVDRTTANRMRDASDALTAAIEQDAKLRAAKILRHVQEGMWVVFGVTAGILILIWRLRRAQERSERLASVLDATPDYVCITTPDLQPLYLNDAYRRLLELASDADLSQADPADPYAPWAQERLRAEGVPAALHGGSWLGEVAFLDDRGREMPMSQRLHAHEAANGAVRYLSAIIRDIGEQKRIERDLRLEQERFAAIVAVQGTVAQADLDMERVMTLIVEGARSLVHADGGAVETMDGDAMVYRVATGVTAPCVGLRIPITTPLLVDCIESGEVQYCADADADPRASKAARKMTGCRSTLLAPVRDAQDVLGILVMQSVRPHAFTERDKQTLQIFAEMVASTLRRAAEFEAKQTLLAERTAALTRLQESEELFRSSLAAMQEGFIVQDWDDNVLMCNLSAERILGAGAGEPGAKTVVRSDWRAICEDGSDFPREDQPSRVALRTGRAQHDVTLGLWREDTGIIWLRMSAAPLFHLGDDAPYASVVTFSDITERKQIQQEVGRLAAIVESTGDAVCAMTLDGTLVSWNNGAERLYGDPAAETIGRHASLLLSPGQDDTIRIVIACVLRGEETAPMEVIRPRKDGTAIDVALTFSPIRGAAGTVTGLGVIGRDITAWKQTERALRRSEARLNMAQQIASIGNWELDVETGRMLWSQEMFQILEFDPGQDEPCDEEMLLRCHPEDQALYDGCMRNAIKNGVSYEVDLRIMTEDETTRWVHVIGHCVCNENAEVIQLHGTLMDVTERKIAEQRIQDAAVALEAQKQELVKVNAQLESLAATDALTDLSNRRAFQIRLDDEMQRAERHGTPLSLVMLDVDTFKHYNDTFGHPAGDGVLRQVAKILQETTREYDLVARYGGEEFVVIFPQTDRASAMATAERCRVAIEGAAWEKRAVTASFGAATLTPDMSADALVALADAALYRSKASGRNCVTHGDALGADLELTANTTDEALRAA